MTTPVPPQPVPPFDTGNQLLAEQPAQLTTALLDTPTGQRLAVTIRTTSATVTALLSQADAKAWASGVKQAADQMSGSGLIVAQPGNGHVPKGTG